MSFLNIDPTPVIAPLFVGNACNWLGMGTLIVQCYYYNQNFPQDIKVIRVLVYTIFFLELVQTATTTHQAWWYLVTNWNQPSALLQFPWSFMTVPVMAGIIAAVVQLFYAWRIWTLSSHTIIRACVYLIIFLAIAQGTIAIVVSGVFQVNPTPENLERLHPEFSSWVAASFVADVLVAGCMLWVLSQAKNQSMVSDTESLLTKLIMNTIGTGSAIALCGALTLALCAATVGKISFQYLPAAYVLGKLYSNSAMVTLNARKTRVTPGHTSQADSMPMRIYVSQDREIDEGAQRKPGRPLEDFRAPSKSVTEATFSMSKNLVV
ncbi:hypothetical protein FB451DRAFT_59231 [Mycena latifolia]|nr:hypothetical protein FB451DRAFT_59231 [Mycena latifolia]